MQEEEFYIGWLAKAPPAFARRTRQFILVSVLSLPVVIGCLVYFQQGFSNGVFEYGKETSLIGKFTPTPAPFLILESTNQTNSRLSPQSILLVGEGKHGYFVDPKEIPAGSKVRVDGFLIYKDGKVALEVKNIAVLEKYASTEYAPFGPTLTAEPISVRGEITDPKCFLGVMNPGEGKPHQDCAVRCLAGGIPPLLKVHDGDGKDVYYLLFGPNGAPLFPQIQQYVGGGIGLCGRIQTFDNWQILYVDTTSIQRINKYALDAGPMCH